MILESKNQCLADYGTFSKNWAVPDFVVERIPIECLYHPKNLGGNPKLVEKLLINLPEEGLVNPLVTHQFFRNYRDRDDQGEYIFPRHLTGSGYWGNKFQNIPYSDGPQYIVGYGNCRLGAAKKMGATHIDCIVLRSFNVEHMHNLGKMLASYKEFGLDD
jgi:hypothetical protein